MSDLTKKLRDTERALKLERETVQRISRQRDQMAAEVERLRGVTPELPPYPSEGKGLPRYGLRWNGPDQPLTVPLDDGYWTPWHLVDAVQQERDQLKSQNDRIAKVLNDAPSADYVFTDSELAAHDAGTIERCAKMADEWGARYLAKAMRQDVNNQLRNKAKESAK